MMKLTIFKTFFAVFCCLFTLLMEVPRALGSENTDRLIMEAKKEGVVVVYGSMSMQEQNNVANKFQEKYPFLTVKNFRLSGGSIVPKVLAEVRAKSLAADVIQGNAVVLYVFKKEDVLGHYLSTENRFYPKQYKDEGYWTTATVNVRVSAYNTRKVARENLPKSYEDILKPAWNGRMMLDLAEQWFVNMLQIMGREKGLNYMRELAKQNLRLSRSISNSMRVQLIAAGETDIDINNTFSEVELLKNKGASVNWITLGPTPAILSGYGVAATAPHPSAARLFLDFALSREGQKIFREAGRPGVRSDLLEDQAVYKNIQIVPLDPSLGDQLSDETKLMRSIFGKK